MVKMLDPEIQLTDADWGMPPDGINAVKWEIKDGAPVSTKSGKCFPLPEQELYAEQLVKFLNSEIAFNRGSWRVVWTQPRMRYYDKLSGLFRVAVPELLECHYLDRDGDVQLVVDIEEDVWTLLDNFSFTSITELCESAYQQWRELINIVDPHLAQMYSPVNGQAETNPHEKIPDLF